MTLTAPVRRADHLDAEVVGEVLALTQAAGDADGAYPLSEHVMLHLRHGGDKPAVHLLVRHGDQLVGYAPSASLAACIRASTSATSPAESRSPRCTRTAAVTWQP